MIEGNSIETNREAIEEMMRMKMRIKKFIGEESGSVVVAVEVEGMSSVREGVEEVGEVEVLKEAEETTAMTTKHLKKLFTEKRQVILKK